MVQIILNGEKKEVADNTTIDKLLETMELPKFFVVEKNLKIIYKEDYKNHVLCDGDSLEVASFCGGG